MFILGGGATSATVSGLPAGVISSIAGNMVTISGTPTVSGGPFLLYRNSHRPLRRRKLKRNYYSKCRCDYRPPTSAAGTDAQTVCISTPITNITYAIGGGGTGATVAGLPAGLTTSFAGGVFTITGTPTASGTFNYTVTTTGPCIKPTATGTITVQANSTISLSSGAGTNNQTKCINVALSNITFAIGGGATGATVTGLPAGVNGVYNAGVFTISGTPTVSGSFPYSVTTTGPCVNPSSGGTITVNADATITLTSAAAPPSQTVCISTPIVNITYAIGGGGTGGTLQLLQDCRPG